MSALSSVCTAAGPFDSRRSSSVVTVCFAHARRAELSALVCFTSSSPGTLAVSSSLTERKRALNPANDSHSFAFSVSAPWVVAQAISSRLGSNTRRMPHV